MERLSGLDASFLYLETPQMHMHVAMTAVLDPADMPGGYSFERIQRLIESRVHLLPAFRRRLVPTPFGLHHPMWVDDPDFDIIRHVRRVAVPSPGGPEELGAICGRIASTPLDRSRPLWEVWVIEGLEHGRFAVMTKVHHAAVDGATGAGLLVHLFSLRRDDEVPKAQIGFRGERIPTQREMIRLAATTRLRQPMAFLKLAGATARAVRGVARRRREPDSLIGATPLRAPRTHWNGSLTAQRNAAFSRVPLAGLKRIKDVHGTKLNDVVLAVVAGALRRYLDGRGELPIDPLVAVCPVSVRPASKGSVARGAGSNHVSGMFTSLATDIDDPVERLLSIRAVTEGAKVEHEAIGASMLQDWAEFAAPTTFNMASRFYSRLRLAERHRPIHNLVISNVPGPQFPIYLAGAQLIAAYPMGPVMEGAGLNATVMSYDGSVDFGFMAATDLVPDLWDLAHAVVPAFEELLEASELAAA